METLHTMQMVTSSGGRARAKAFGKALKLARVAKDLTQAEVAELLEVHATAVSQWERGDRADVPDQDTVAELEKALEAGGALQSAAGYAVSDDDDVEVPAAEAAVAAPAAPSRGLVLGLPLPENLVDEDIAVLAAMARQLSAARNGDRG